MHRVFVEKRAEFANEARRLLVELRESLELDDLTGLRLVQRYDLEGLDDAEFDLAVGNVLSEPQTDHTAHELDIPDGTRAFAVEYLPGQFDQRADSAAQCIQILTGKERPAVASARILLLEGTISDADLDAIKRYVINAVDSHEASMTLPDTLGHPSPPPPDVEVLEGFGDQNPETVRAELGLAMSAEDVAFCQKYFAGEEQRDPSITEIRMLDTYWSDHCRHTTFLTKIDQVTFDEGTEPIQRAWKTYLDVREKLGREEKPVTLMDIALAGMRELRASGELDNLEESEEINAASIIVPVEISPAPHSPLPAPRSEEWLIQFKNETHNHPTEIEPFGGAATCLGGCIRDPLSGRSYVYQAMRVTGAADPLAPFSETLPGKLPQRKICQIAAEGYASYGNQIGLATGQVAEVYHPGYLAKRMEIGAVVAAAPRENVFRGSPAAGDLILLIGGRTGRDGVGGATGSSKEHDDSALDNSAEVQKGDAPTERKIQRLFRNADLARRIKICNDFGAGGVSVAIGEIAPSLDINLDAVTKKYDGLDGTELAISESQERMAVCVDPSDLDFFISASDAENLECTQVATVANHGRLRMTWRGKTIVDLSRAFLDNNCVQQADTIHVAGPRLTNELSSNHERSILERCPPEVVRSSLGAAGERVADVLRRVREAGERTGLDEPEDADGRHRQHRALRSLEEREIRSRLTDLFLDPEEFLQAWRDCGELGGAEQKVHPSSDGLHFIKANTGFYHGTWSQFFERLHLHRLLFPDAAYEFLGFIEDDGELCCLIQQPAVPAFHTPEGPAHASRAQVEAFMQLLGAYRFRNDDYYLPTEDLLIEDLHDENVLLGSDGLTLRFIDPVIYRRPADVGIPKPAPQSLDLPSHLAKLNHCSQKGLGEMFDGSVGAGTVLWPFGGDRQLTPPDAMVAKLPLLEGDTDTCSYMSWAYDPSRSSESPFHGSAWAVTESALKCVAAGARLSDIRLTLQEYFPKLGNDPSRWGLPFAALLGAFDAQHGLRLAAIGGKDSMSGSFNELDVPPTLVSFALAPGQASLTLSPEFKQPGSTISLIEIPPTDERLPDYPAILAMATKLHGLNKSGGILSMKHVGSPGLAHALAVCCCGNHLGLRSADDEIGTTPRPAAFLLEHTEPLHPSFGAVEIGTTTEEPTLQLGDESHTLDDLLAAWTGTLEPVYPTRPEAGSEMVDDGCEMVDVPLYSSPSTIHHPPSTISRPKVVIPAFPGTNSEYDSAKAFREAGADSETLVFRNLTAAHLEESLAALASKIRESQILFLPGGFSSGDEPDGSAKFITAVLRSPRVAEAVMDLLQNRDGLILGICNGFQALIKTGLVPYGEIREPDPVSPTLFHNDIGRHVSCYARTRITSTLSPWFAACSEGDLHRVPVSHGEGKFIADAATIGQLAAAGQIATQYCDAEGKPSMDIAYNPNGSHAAVEGITSPCGRVLGKMGHTERRGTHVAKNIPGNKHQPLFKAGVKWFS